MLDIKCPKCGKVGGVFVLSIIHEHRFQCNSCNKRFNEVHYIEKPFKQDQE